MAPNDLTDKERRDILRSILKKHLGEDFKEKVDKLSNGELKRKLERLKQIIEESERKIDRL